MLLLSYAILTASGVYALCAPHYDNVYVRKNAILHVFIFLQFNLIFRQTAFLFLIIIIFFFVFVLCIVAVSVVCEKRRVECIATGRQDGQELQIRQQKYSRAAFERDAVGVVVTQIYLYM